MAILQKHKTRLIGNVRAYLRNVHLRATSFYKYYYDVGYTGEYADMKINILIEQLNWFSRHYGQLIDAWDNVKAFGVLSPTILTEVGWRIPDNVPIRQLRVGEIKFSIPYPYRKNGEDDNAHTIDEWYAHMTNDLYKLILQSKSGLQTDDKGGDDDGNTEEA